MKSHMKRRRKSPAAQLTIFNGCFLVAGISLSDYIRRRKMTQAAFELQATDSRVMDIALKYGYASPTAKPCQAV